MFPVGLPKTIPASFTLGLDLGQAADYSALTVLERCSQAFVPGQRLPPASYRIRLLARYPLKTPYPQIVREVAELLDKPEPGTSKCPLRGCVLGVDQTGCGAPVVDLFREARLPCKLAPVLITGGSHSHFEGSSHRIPKGELVSVLTVLLQNKQLRWDGNTKEGQLLLQECSHFRSKVSLDTGNTSYEAWRERDHDDLLLATAIACWLGERISNTPTAKPIAVGGMPNVHPGLLYRGNHGWRNPAG